MDRKSRQGCIWIGLGVAILVCVVGGGLLGGLAWAAYQSFSFKADFIPPDAAEREFEQARAKFAGQRPLIEVGDDGAARVVPRTAPGGSADVASIHVLVYTPDVRKLARVTVPFWLVRLSPQSGTARFDNDDVKELHGVKITIGDIERAGPGLLLDHQRDDGSRVLIWSD